MGLEIEEIRRLAISYLEQNKMSTRKMIAVRCGHGSEHNQHQELTRNNPPKFDLKACYARPAVPNRFDDDGKMKAS